MKAQNLNTSPLILGVLLALLMGLSALSNAQSFTPQGNEAGFNVESGVSLDETILIEDSSFELYATEGGSKYIKCISSRTGNPYAVWIGTPTNELYQGRTVYQMKSGTYCVYKLSRKSGNPYPMWLEKK